MIMIPTKVTEAEFDEMVQRVLDVLDAGTPEQKARGAEWYTTARDLALIIGAGDVSKGAGIIAALSANKSWSMNVRLAHSAAEGKLTGHTAANLRKAAMIMEGWRPEDVLPMQAKTGNFYRCIVNPHDTEAVCVDRHAHDIAVGERYGNRNRGLGTASRYELIANVYRRVAAIRGCPPPTVQAQAWVIWLDMRDAM